MTGCGPYRSFPLSQQRSWWAMPDHITRYSLKYKLPTYYLGNMLADLGLLAPVFISPLSSFFIEILFSTH